MKTSAYQFEVLVTFMEEHGDLGKPQNTSKKRLASLNKWEEITAMLNSDISGDSKSSSKWKKERVIDGGLGVAKSLLASIVCVEDTETKKMKKMVWADLKNNTKKKLIRIERAAHEEGPPVQAKLTELEQRVLYLMGLQVGRILPIEEHGSSSQEEETIDIKPNIHGLQGPQRHPRRLRTGHTYELAQKATMSDEEWRKFKVQQHRDHIELKREQNRIREMEIQAQLGWQDIGTRALDLLDKLVNKYCKD